MEYIIQTKDVSFSYSKKKKALSNVSINVPKGCIYGFLGPNGAGKSTTMQLLTGILPYEKDGITVFGNPLHSQLPNIFSKIGALIESPSLYLHLSGFDNLRCITTLRNIPESKILEVLELVNLAQNSSEKVKTYSLGMKQRLAIAMTLLGEPELLLLDEPVNGLDPAGMSDIRELLVKLNREKGVTIFISSHLLSEIERMCTHIGIVHKGNLLFEGTMDELYEKTNFYEVHVETAPLDSKIAILKAQYPNISVEGKSKFSVLLKNKEEIARLSEFMVNNQIPLYSLRSTDRLESSFLNLTK